MDQFVEIRGPGLKDAQRVVIVIHGMSTTVESLQKGYPNVDTTLTKVYWHLPVLRAGKAELQERRSRDVFRDLFGAVIDKSRHELTQLVRSLGDRPVGIFGFSIGSLVALWGALDNPSVRAVVTVGGVPSLDYLQHYYETYPWSQPEVQAKLETYDVTEHAHRFNGVPVLVCHGGEDAVAQWAWMKPFADALVRYSPASRVCQFPHMRHRLLGEDDLENQELETLRQMADTWFRQHLAVPHDA